MAKRKAAGPVPAEPIFEDEDVIASEMRREIDWSEGENSDAFADYVAAIYRLRRGAPKNHPPFVAIVEEGGRVPLTQESVALEANRPRSRISGRDADFKKLAAYIKSLRPTHGVSDNTLAKLRRQSAEIAFLEQRVKVYQSRHAAAVITIDALRRDLSDLEATAARRK